MATIPFHHAALGTSIEGVLEAETAAGHQLWTGVRAQIDRFADRFSRFLPASELSQVNSRPGTWVIISPEMLALLLAGRAVWEQTDHFVDPTIGYALIAAGYDRSFELLTKQEHRPLPAQKMVRASMEMVEIDEVQRRVRIPIGISLDFGGIGKGYLLDQLQPILSAMSTNYWLSLGDDRIVSGRSPDGEPWPINVQDPLHPEQEWGQLRITQPSAAVATTGTTKRQGTRNGQTWHHIIDPHTGRPSTTDIVAATVITSTGLDADAFAKNVLLRGSTEGIAWAEARSSVEALAITRDGQSQQTSGFAQFLQRA